MADYTAADFGPAKHCNKQQEMAVRRAYDLNAGLIEALRAEGTLADVKRLHRSMIIEHKNLRDIFDFGSPEWKYKDRWDWVVDHWYSGALKRSVETTMHNMNPTNVKAIKGRINELYG